MLGFLYSEMLCGKIPEQMPEGLVVKAPQKQSAKRPNETGNLGVDRVERERLEHNRRGREFGQRLKIRRQSNPELDEAVKAKEREMYRLRQERNGLTVKTNHPTSRGYVPYTEEEKKQRFLESQKRYRDKHRAKLRAYYREIKRANKAHLKATDPEAYRKLIKSKSDYDKNYRRKMAVPRREKTRQYVARRMATDVNYVMRQRLRSRVFVAIKKGYGKKSAKTMDLIGCTIETLKAHIQSLFTDGMTWDKFLAAEIELDHIIPCAAFDLTKAEEQKKCFHWSNMQPLWVIDNLMKGDKMPDGTLARYSVQKSPLQAAAA